MLPPSAHTGPSFLYPASTWATIAAAIFAGGALLYGFLSRHSDVVANRRQVETQQARAVAGYIEESSVPRDPIADPFEVTGHPGLDAYIVNRSLLPIRSVRAYVWSTSDDTLHGFPAIVIIPGEQSQRVQIRRPILGAAYRLILTFDDDSGQRWQKYELAKPSAYGIALDKLGSDDPNEIQLPTNNRVTKR